MVRQKQLGGKQMITANSSKKQKAFSDSSIAQSKKEAAFTLFKKKMSDAEKSLLKQGLISEEDAETELAKI